MKHIWELDLYKNTIFNKILLILFFWRRKWQPTPVFLPRESCGQRSLGAVVHRVAQSRTWLKRLSMHAWFFLVIVILLLLGIWVPFIYYHFREFCWKLLNSGTFLSIFLLWSENVEYSGVHISILDSPSSVSQKIAVIGTFTCLHQRWILLVFSIFANIINELLVID